MFSKSIIYGESVFFILMVVGVLAQRFQLLPFKLAFGLFSLSMLLAALFAVVAFFAILLSYGPLAVSSRGQLLGVVFAGLLPMVMILAIVGAGLKVPKIHDISTNTDNNLVFTKSHTLRGESDNSLDLPSDEVMAAQKQYYSLAPLEVSMAPEKAFERALETARQLGWNIVHEDSDSFVFEANESTAIFGFVDDVVVRVSAAGEGSVIDMRSVSRVGVSDLGANAKRIQRFQDSYRKATE